MSSPDVQFRTAAAADIPTLHRLIERAYRGDSARRGWTHEADLLDGQRTDAQALAEALARDTFDARTMEMTVIRQRGELIAYYERRGYRLTGEARPFPLDDPRFGLPRTRELGFVVLAKPLA